jgi:lipocalin-like protein
MRIREPKRVRDALAAMGLSLCAASYAQQGTASLREQIVGTWVPVSQYVDQDGKKLEPFGSNPKGMVVYDANGRFILVLQRATLPRFASNNRLAGTAEENKAIVQGSIAYFGKYSVDENERKLRLHYDGSTFPNWDGEDQTRTIELSGDELRMVSPVSAVGGGVVHLVLRRAR